MADGAKVITERLLLRPLAAEDARFFCRLMSDDPDSLALFIESGEPCHEDGAKAWIARRDALGGETFAIVHPTFETFMGIIAYGGSSHVPRLMLWIGAPYRGHGYGHEALAAIVDRISWTGAILVESECRAENDVARDLLTRHDFREMGLEARQGGNGASLSIRHFLLDLRS